MDKQLYSANDKTKRLEQVMRFVALESSKELYGTIEIDFEQGNPVRYRKRENYLVK